MRYSIRCHKKVENADMVKQLKNIGSSHLDDRKPDPVLVPSFLNQNVVITKSVDIKHPFNENGH